MGGWAEHREWRTEGSPEAAGLPAPGSRSWGHRKSSQEVPPLWLHGICSPEVKLRLRIQPPFQDIGCAAGRLPAEAPPGVSAASQQSEARSDSETIHADQTELIKPKPSRSSGDYMS